jgi:hypothetical protein
VADLASIGGMASGIGSIALQWLKFGLYGLVGGGAVVGIVWIYLKRKKYDYSVIYYNTDGVTGGTDKGGIFVDSKTKAKKFWLKNANAGLNCDRVPWRLINNKRVVELVRYGVKNFRFVDNSGIADGIEADISEEDVNWGLLDYEKQKQIFGHSLLKELLPYIIIAFTAMVILIMVFIVMNKLEVFNQAADKLVQAASILRDINTGTTVLPGG